MKRILVMSASVGLLVFFASGCATPTLSTFKPAPPLCSTAKAGTIYVNPIQEARPLEGRSHVGTGFLAWIPLVPFAPQQWTPERHAQNVYGIKSDFKGELGTVIARDLGASGLARNVVVSEKSRVPQDQQESNAYYLDVQLKEGIWHRNMTMYGLSLPGFCLSFIGAPVSYGSFELALKCALKDSKGALLGETALSSKVGITEGLYYNTMMSLPGKVLASYTEVSPQLRTFVAQSMDGVPYGNAPVTASNAVGAKNSIVAGGDIAPSSAAPVTPPVQPTRKSLTNSDVVTMLKASLSESTIIMAVKRRPALFDTSPDALIELKNQGATAGILDAMMQP